MMRLAAFVWRLWVGYPKKAMTSPSTCPNCQRLPAELERLQARRAACSTCSALS